MRPPDEVKRELVRQWLARADEDLGVAKVLLTEDAPYAAAAAFHAQQTAEKALKALLAWHQVEFPKTHVGALLDLLATVDSPLAESLREAPTLNPYGVDVRYPGDIPPTTVRDAHRAVETAAKVRTAVAEALEGRV